MPVYLVTYDLNKNKNYPDLYRAIEGPSSTWCHALDSVYFVKSTATALQLRDHIGNAIDNDDSLIVVQIPTPAAAGWINLTASVSNWLKEHLDSPS